MLSSLYINSMLSFFKNLYYVFYLVFVFSPKLCQLHEDSHFGLFTATSPASGMVSGMWMLITGFWMNSNCFVIMKLLAECTWCLSMAAYHHRIKAVGTIQLSRSEMSSGAFFQLALSKRHLYVDGRVTPRWKTSFLSRYLWHFCRYSKNLYGTTKDAKFS